MLLEGWAEVAAPIGVTTVVVGLLSAGAWRFQRPPRTGPRIAVKEPLGPWRDEDGRGHGHADQGPDFDRDVRDEIAALSAKLDSLIDRRPSLVRYVAGNVFWSIFGVIASLIIGAWTADAPSAARPVYPAASQESY